jgi:glycosyltransferase involved in cell wall biosynthesis
VDSLTNGGGSTRWGSKALEEILCGVVPIGSIDDLVPHVADAWSGAYPNLASLPKFEGEPGRLKICIATEDIVGPVRNGGIGTTYSALAELLGRLGHDVTILYLKGYQVENGTVDQWIDYYAARSVRFVPVPNYAAADKFQTGADRWLHAPYNMLKYLADHPMDVVHVSEWRGSGYLSLLAKRQGLAFQDTLFIVKTSSPWIWNRLYGSQPLDRVEDLALVHAERRSVEFADMVIGGSLHLLRWMSSQGYKIPAQRTFVQPNVVVFDHLADLMTHRNWEKGKRHPIDEIVFFGRLEARKGLFIFLQAIKRLLRQGSRLPRQVTFMGKPGARLMARPDQDILDYIRTETEGWPTKVEILSDFQQYEALKYLLSGDRLAVMPSMIENSSLAVYEAAICGIPFIASTSGGTPELVAEADHPEVLCDAHPIPVADKIAEALEHGAYVARPSFDNEANLEDWRQFHLDLGRGLLEKLLPPPPASATLAASVSVCIYHADTDDRLRRTLESVKDQDHPAEEVLIAVDTDDMASLDRASAIAREVGVAARVVAAFDLDAGQSFNVLARQASGEFVFFLWAGATIRPLALRALAKVAASSNADLVNYFFRVVHDGEEERDYLSAIVFGNVAQSFFRSDVTSLPLLVRRRVFAELGGFTSDYRVLAHDHELVAKAQISGVHCETALLELGTVPGWEESWLKAKCYGQGAAQFRAIRPELAATPLALRELLLMAKGLHKVERGRVGKAAARRRAEKAKADKEQASVPLGLGRLLMAGRRKPRALAEAPASAPTPVPMFANDGVAAPLEPDAVAREARQDRKAAREGGQYGAGLVQLIDRLSAESLEVEKAAPVQRARISDPLPPVERSAPRPPFTSHVLSTTKGRRYVGRILGVYKGVAYGWVRNEDRPDETVELELANGRGRPRPMRADRNLPTVEPLPGELGRHGFIVPVWHGLKSLQRFRPPRDLAVRIKGTSISVGDISVPADPRRLDQAGYDGYCDVFDTMLRGWVWQPANPDEPVDVSVFMDGKFLSRVTAANVREDLRAANIGNGAYGFAVALPRLPNDRTPHLIEVVVADSGAYLKRGRLQLVGKTLTVLK